MLEFWDQDHPTADHAPALKRLTDLAGEHWGPSGGPNGMRITQNGLVARVTGDIEAYQTGWHAFASDGYHPYAKYRIAGLELGRYSFNEVYLEAGKRYPIEILYDAAYTHPTTDQGIRITWATPARNLARRVHTNPDQPIVRTDIYATATRKIEVKNYATHACSENQNHDRCQMKIGACYYPEHWAVERWAIDARMMKEAGFNVIRTGDFNWTRLETAPDKFDFGWLDQALEVFAQQGISVMMTTPTAAPPAWLMQAHPEIAPTRADGRRSAFGGRRHYCPHQPAFRSAVIRIVSTLAKKYATNPNIIAWQVDNEQAAAFHGGHCFCTLCEGFFQDWLQRHYQHIDALNEAWGTDFWSMNFSTWSEIPAPRDTGGPHNPSLLLAWRRYYTEVWCNFQTFQNELLRANGVTTPITTNLTGLSWGFDPFTMAEKLDVVSWDNYPMLANLPLSELEGRGHVTPALACDFMRGVNRGNPYWVTEQQSGAGGQSEILGPYATRPDAHVELSGPGAWRCHAHLLPLAILPIRGRSSIGMGFCNTIGRPNWRLREATQIATEFHSLPADLFTARTPTRVGVLVSAQQAWSHEIQAHVKGFSYKEEILGPYEALRRSGIDVDILYEGSDLSAYRLLVASSFQMITPEVAEQIQKFVHNGGTLVTNFRSSVKKLGWCHLHRSIARTTAHPPGHHHRRYGRSGSNLQ